MAHSPTPENSARMLALSSVVNSATERLSELASEVTGHDMQHIVVVMPAKLTQTNAAYVLVGSDIGTEGLAGRLGFLAELMDAVTSGALEMNKLPEGH